MISSHILTELAEMCTHIAIIERGHLLASGDVQKILRSLQPHRTLELRVLEGAARAEALLRTHPGVLDVRRDGLATAAMQEQPDATEKDTTVPEDHPPAPVDASPDDRERVAQPEDFVDYEQALTLLVDYAGDERGMADLLTLLISNHVVVSRFAEQSSDLEDIFMHVTKGIVQ
jgi:ABC-2 type transport system ATP-binding protein